MKGGEITAVKFDFHTREVPKIYIFFKIQNVIFRILLCSWVHFIAKSLKWFVGHIEKDSKFPRQI